MAHGKEYVSFIVDDRNQISEFLGQFSSEMQQYVVEKRQSNFIMFYKYLTHSDLATFGKATKVDSHDDNLLYYITSEDMRKIEENTNRPFQTAHQSCISLSESFYSLIGLPNPRNTDPYTINDYMSVKLVNSSLKYFKSLYTKMVFDKLSKDVSGKRSWDFGKIDISLSNGKFTEITLDIAVHGIGMAKSEEFHKLRHHMFKGDTFVLLYEQDLDEKNLFIVLEKNPIFFNIIGETNTEFAAYQKRIRNKAVSDVSRKQNAVDNDDLNAEVTRQQQSAWRKMLANEMMAYTQTPNSVFCPLTYITADFESLGTLFVASHIKGFKDPNTSNEEKYDINNGLLLVANADALFDKHLISINEKQELEFSFLLDADIRLKTQLLLMSPIFKPVLNEKRMEYLKYHYNRFKELEKTRKNS